MTDATVDRPRRWQIPFGPNMTEDKVDRVMSEAPFSRIAPENFPGSLPLCDILKNDTRIQIYQSGDVVVKRGDYGNSAFFILSGSARAEIDPEGNLLARAVRRPRRKKRTLFQALSQLWTNPDQPEVRDVEAYNTDSSTFLEQDLEQTRLFLQDVPGIVAWNKARPIDEGEFFGEIAALGRTPRTATIIAQGRTEILEIRWQGLRDIRRYTPEIREHIDRNYRQFSLHSHLAEMPIFKHLTADAIDALAEKTTFAQYGDFDWFGSFKQLAEKGADEKLRTEPVIALEGQYPSSLILIRSGFARVSRRMGNSHQTMSYLGRGEMFGFEEIVNNWRAGSPIPLHHTIRAVGYVDVLTIPIAAMEQFVLPTMPERLLPEPVPEVVDEPTNHQSIESVANNETLEFLVERRYINGKATMLIDMNRCTRCDDCVRACASTHDNNPRFIRHGPIVNHTMVTNACMHCYDPVCMIGCPTGAIHREITDGQVVIDDLACIGCSTCANSCPYENIRMVPIRNERGQPITASQTQEPILKATKCDLCADQLGGPACQRACPHDALQRVDMLGVEALQEWNKR